MSVLTRLAAGLFLSVCLAVPAVADMTTSQSNDPAADLGQSLTALFGQERTGLSAAGDARLTAITAKPAAPVKVAKKARGKVVAPAYDTAWLQAQAEPLAVVSEVDEAGKDQRQRHPDARPGQRFANRDDVRLAMEDSEVEREQNKNEDKKSDPDDHHGLQGWW
jgi:hypothetical protein